MKRIVAVLSLLTALLIAAPLATAMLPTPSGLPSKGIQIGEGVDFSGLINGAAPTHAHMNDAFGYCWDLDISISGSVATFSGTCPLERQRDLRHVDEHHLVDGSEPEPGRLPDHVGVVHLHRKRPEDHVRYVDQRLRALGHVAGQVEER